MKTRIIWTKIWDDSWFDSLDQNSRILFIYLITNQDINLSGCFYLPDKKIIYHTHLTEIELKDSKSKLSDKIKFLDDWVYVINSQGYNHFTGNSNEVAIKKELEQIPKNIKDTLLKDKTYTPSGGSVQSYNHNHNNNHNKYKLVGNTMVEI